jgi:site-specific recombinase XerD
MGNLDPDRVRFTGPLEPFVPGLREELARLGYARTSTATLLQLAAHLSRWLEALGVGPGDLTGTVIDRFVVERRRRYTNYRCVAGLAPILGYLRGLGVTPVPVSVVAVLPAEVLLERFAQYLAGQRALTGPVVVAYCHWVRPFTQVVLFPDGVDRVGVLTAADVSRFLAARLPVMSRKSAQMTTCSVRSLLRFLHAQGLITSSLADVVPAVASWRLSGLPQALSADQVQALLGACDRTSAVGRRDVAVITMLRRLGLRCAEVAGLELSDIDWSAGTVTIHGKGARTDRLPLPVDVGEAVVEYLRHGRPRTAARTVFVRAMAPFHAFGAGERDVHRGARCPAGGAWHGARPPAAPHRGERDVERGGVVAGGRPVDAARVGGDHRHLRQDRPQPVGPDRPALAGRGGPAMSAQLHAMVGDYLRVRRSLGYKLVGTEHVLFAFVDYLQDHDAPTLTVEHAVRFATSRPGVSSRHHALRLSAIRCFARWAHTLDADVQIPPAKLLPARVTRAAPYLYTGAEVAALLEAADELRPAIRAATFHTLVALMSATGIRTGEALGLDLTNFDAQAGTLTVTGKFGKTRMLPLHETVTTGLGQYLAVRADHLAAAGPAALLTSTAGTRLSPGIVHPTFRQLTARAGLRPVSSACRPRLHDLRH